MISEGAHLAGVNEVAFGDWEPAPVNMGSRRDPGGNWPCDMLAMLYSNLPRQCNFQCLVNGQTFDCACDLHALIGQYARLQNHWKG
jgi:hypothetical protein